MDELAARQFQVDVPTAAALIMEGRVWIGSVPADKAGTPVPADTVLSLREKPRKFASRSGYKLEKALAVFSVDPAGKTVCDIGASNGGFTDCLLQNGAAHVFSVDVAYGILDWKLRSDPRVTVLERTNARRLTPAQLENTPCDLVTVDVSFISLTKIFPAIHAILQPAGELITLIKPQFEAQPRQLGKNGILRNPEADLPPLLGSIFTAAAEQALYLTALTVSPIHGSNGNVEYLAHYRHGAPAEGCPPTPEFYSACMETALCEQPDM